MTTLQRHLQAWTCALLLLSAPLAARAAEPLAAGQDVPQASAAPETPRATPAPRSPQPAAAPRAAAEQGNPFTEGFEQDPVFNARPVVRVGQDYHVTAGSTVREVVVVTGSVIIDGRVERDVVVVLGSVRLGPEAVVNGSMVTVAGTVTVAPGAQVRRDFVVAGGSVDAPPSFNPGGEHVVIGASGVAERIQAVVPWATRGLLLGRLIVPSLPWMWTIVAVVFFIYLTLNLLFERPIRACAAVLATKPLSTFFVGLLVLLLTGPVAFILVVSVVGIVVLPFALCALLIAWLFGKVAVSRALGASVIVEDEPGNKLQATRSFAIGFAMVTVAYMIPVLGLVTFVLVAVFGLGSASMALLAGLRRENPARPKPPRPLPTSPVGPSVTTPGGPGTASAPGYAASALAAGPAPAAYETPAYEAPAYHAASEEPPVMPSSPPVMPLPPPVAGTLIAMPKATLLERAAAFALDIVLVLFGYAMLPDWLFRGGPQSFFLLLLVYHVVFWTMKATTVGGIICNLRLVRTDGGAVTLQDAIIRGLSSILSIITAGIGCLWIAFDAERQAWHDRIAGTYVVKVPRNWPV